MKTEAERKAEYLAALESKASEIRDLLADMRHAINDKEKKSQDEFNWGHVGDLNRVAELLKEAVQSTGYKA